MYSNNPVGESQNVVLYFAWAGLVIYAALYVYYLVPFFNKRSSGTTARKLSIGIVAVCAFISAAAEAYEPVVTFLLGSLTIAHVDNLLYFLSYLIIGIGAWQLYRNNSGEKLMWIGILADIPIVMIVALSWPGGTMLFISSLALSVIPIGLLGLLAIKHPR